MLVECTSEVPVVERLAQHKSLLSETAVRNYPVDRDEKLEAAIAGLPKDLMTDVTGRRSGKADDNEEVGKDEGNHDGGK